MKLFHMAYEVCCILGLMLGFCFGFPFLLVWLLWKWSRMEKQGPPYVVTLGATQARAASDAPEVVRANETRS